MGAIEDYLKSTYNRLTYTPESYRTLVRSWMDWYNGYFKAFHDYRQYNGRVYVSRQRYSLGMGKKLCEDHASLLMNEKVQIQVKDNKAAQEALDEVLKRNNFYVRSNQLVEIAFAGGTGAFVEFMDAKGRVNIDYIRATQIYPITTDNGEITECAFASIVARDDKTEEYYINIHTLDTQGNYVIENKRINSAGAVLELEGVEATINTGSPRPRFQIIKPNIVNNFLFDSGMGISIYANAIDLLKSTDLVFDSYCNEFRLGKKRILVPVGMIQMITDTDGVVKPVFDDNDTEFYAIPKTENFDEYQELNGELRVEPHDTALQKFLNLLSAKCGLGQDYYSFDGAGAAKTATEVVSEKSDLYQNMKKNELVLDSALVAMAEVILEMLGHADAEVEVQFDDSILTNRDAERNRMVVFVASGAYPFREYLIRYEGYSEAEADEVINAQPKVEEDDDVLKKDAPKEEEIPPEEE